MSGGRRAGAGRPPVGDVPRSVRIPVFMSEAEVALLDAQRGEITRSEWLVVQAGIRSSPQAPGDAAEQK